MGVFSNVSISPAYSCQPPVSDISLAYFRLEMSPFGDNISLLSVPAGRVTCLAEDDRKLN